MPRHSKVLEEEKFKILDEVRKWTSKQNSPVTLSVGIAYGGSDLTQLAKLSQNNLDLALGRGGDQVVVKAVEGQARFTEERLIRWKTYPSPSTDDLTSAD